MGGYWIVYRGTQLPVPEGESTIGRSPECSILLADPSVSRHHAVLRRSIDELELEDLRSRFGTLVNGEKVTKARTVRPEDSIVIGRVAVQLVASLDEVDPWQGPRLAYADDGAPDITTNTDVSATDHIRSLILLALERNRQGDQAGVIGRAIERAAIEWAAEPRRDPATAERLLAQADMVASWFPDGSMDEWLAKVRTRLGSRT